MTDSRATIPDFTLRTTVDMEAIVAARQSAKASAASNTSVPSVNDIMIRTAALALREHPQVNASFVNGALELHERVNIGVAVDVPGSLLVPVVLDADQKSIAEIATETRYLRSRARDGTITPNELSGGTFTISNLGMLGVEDFDAVINVPQAAILAVGRVTEQPVAVDGEIVVCHVARLRLTCDHRVVYGAAAASFLARLQGLLERETWSANFDE